MEGNGDRRKGRKKRQRVEERNEGEAGGKRSQITEKRGIKWREKIQREREDTK